MQNKTYLQTLSGLFNRDTRFNSYLPSLFNHVKVCMPRWRSGLNEPEPRFLFFGYSYFALVFVLFCFIRTGHRESD